MSHIKTALICGIGGQDGALLAKFLLGKGYRVYGTSRDAQRAGGNLIRLGIADRVIVLSMNPQDFRSVYSAINSSAADEVYFLAGQTSVGFSFEEPAETMQSISLGTLNMLEAARMSSKPFRFYSAGSGECFGSTNKPAHEKTPFSPQSPYGVAKASAAWLVNNYREAYDLYACTGILFNHESILRPSRFVTQKVVKAARAIAEGSVESLQLGRLDIARDWGWAPEYVEAMWLMLQQKSPDDYVIATGKTYTLESFVEEVFSQFGLNWRDHVKQDPELFRPSDIQRSLADPSKARKELGWRARYDMPKVVSFMVEGE